MAVRMPSNFGRRPGEGDGPDVLGLEILAEKAASLGRAGDKVAAALALLRDNEEEGERTVLLKAAAEAVHAYFIQRELCGLRRHDAAIREYDIPGAVLARLGVR